MRIADDEDLPPVDQTVRQFRCAHCCDTWEVYANYENYHREPAAACPECGRVGHKVRTYRPNSKER